LRVAVVAGLPVETILLAVLVVVLVALLLVRLLLL
jgi:hypothetical protein